MSLPPIEEAPRSMTRRNYLVERNRLRVNAYAPTRKELEEEDIRVAQARQEQRRKLLGSWKSQSSYNPDLTRPLPGGGPHSKRMKEAAALKNPNYYKIVKEEEAQLKAERTAMYKADMQQQLKDRREYLSKWHADEKAYVTALVENQRELARQMEEREREDAKAKKAYMDRMRESNLRELEQKRLKEKEREEYELSILRDLQHREKEKAATEERRARDLKRMMQKENEEYHRSVVKKQEEDKAREEAELKSILEFNAALAERERQEQQQKREQYKAEFEETIEKQKEFHRTHNYEEPPESIRERNEKAAASLALIKQEERLRLADRRREYRNELMQQIREKQEWQLSHIDGV
ncbi:uncharacterized protein Tco025E_06490 [Trypanosoma conorhini]|uniref:Trichohyalin-plectin-homology domain-containing protein n=1 Tax=Trypanosoma conorhini TaxID=83891 RepID=A0A3R7P3M0_9TRYP|nr:uncharacterized protein Tco025E_06490 [Trypanosoma conorhini]RNF12221.1 hypothetical protein Tco025E_06490 [Trypanosoma conorhini]